MAWLVEGRTTWPTNSRIWKCVSMSRGGGAHDKMWGKGLRWVEDIRRGDEEYQFGPWQSQKLVKVLLTNQWTINLTFIGLCIVIHFYSKTNQMHQFLKFILFCNGTLHVSDGLSVHCQESKTVYAASGICQTDSADCLLAGTRWNGSSISFPLASSQQNLFDIYLMLYVQS